jgi:hypothetical protein
MARRLADGSARGRLADGLAGSLMARRGGASLIQSRITFVVLRSTFYVLRSTIYDLRFIYF